MYASDRPEFLAQKRRKNGFLLQAGLLSGDQREFTCGQRLVTS